MAVGKLHRKIFLGSGAALGTLVFLAIVVVLQYIAVNNPKRWDVTQNKKFTLSSQSSGVLQTFKKNNIPVEILAFYESKDQGAREEVRDLLDQYRDVYSGFSYSFIDPDKERAVAIKNKIDSYPTMVIRAGEKDERITVADEETVTNALVKLLRTEAKKVYLLKGHGELSPEVTGDSGFSVAKQQIEKQNYKVEELVLLQSPAVPDDAAMLLIAGPKTDPMDEELAALRDYLERGGSLMVLLNPFKTPNLAAFLAEFGFLTKDDIVVDRMSRALGGDYLMPVITSYVKFPITKNFDLASFFPEVRSVRVSEKPSPKVESQELALTSPVSWTINEEQLTSGNANFDEKTGTKGPISVMAVSQYKCQGSNLKEGEKNQATEGNESSSAAALEKPLASTDPAHPGDNAPNGINPRKARVVVFGSSLLASNKFYKLQGNGDLFMNTVSWLAEDENLISIRPKSSRSRPFVLTARESSLVFIIPVILVPFAWLLAGVLVYSYRRRATST